MKNVSCFHFLTMITLYLKYQHFITSESHCSLHANMWYSLGCNLELLPQDVTTSYTLHFFNEDSLMLKHLQEQWWSRSAFWSDTNGPARISSAILGQRVRDSHGEYSFCAWVNSVCILWTDWCALHIVSQTHHCPLVAAGTDSIYAGGGSGSEIHCSPGAGAPLGHCEYSVIKCMECKTFIQLHHFPQKHWLFPCLMQDEGLCENEHQLSVAGKIKKHFNTSPRVNDTTAGVSVISVSYHSKLKCA